MDPLRLYGLLRAALFFPLLVLVLSVALWLYLPVVQAPRKPGWLLGRVQAAAWGAIAWQATVYLLDVPSKGRVVAMFESDLWFGPPVSPTDVESLQTVMTAEFLGSLVLHAALLSLAIAARRRLLRVPQES